jgi:hypothetical protein
MRRQREANEREAAELECAECARLRAERDEAKLSYARLRDDYRRLAESYKALRAEVRRSSEPGQYAGDTVAFGYANFPYPREWELEDSELREENNKLREALEAIRDTCVAYGEDETELGCVECSFVATKRHPAIGPDGACPCVRAEKALGAK